MATYSKSILRSTYALLDQAQRKKGLAIVILMLTNALLDFFSLASFLPILMLVVNPAFRSGNTLVAQLYRFFEFTSTAAFVISLTVGVFLFVAIKSQINKWISSAKGRFAFGIGNDIAIRKVVHYLEMSHVDYSDMDFAKELSRITAHPIAFANNIILPVTTIITETLVSILILIGIALYDYKVLVLVFIILIPALLIYWLRRKNLKEINRDLKEKYPLLTKYALQIVAGLSDIRVYKKEWFFLERFRSTNQSITNTLLKDQAIQNSTVRMTEMAMSIIICSLVIYSVSAQQDYQQTLMLLGIYAVASFRVLPSVNRILHASQQIKIHEYLFDELNATHDVLSIQNESSSSSLTFQGSLEWRNISFRYPGLPPLLQNASLRIRKGEKVGLTGKSGAGKSTLLLILLRLLKTAKGEMLVDGKPLSDPDTMSHLFGYVAQNPYLMDGTIAENIAFGVPLDAIDRSKVLRLMEELDLSGLSHQLASGIDTRIGERGIKLSGGQVQRVAIARALYADAEILLLDEITNQLHRSIEFEIMNLLGRLAEKGKTIVIVTHKIPDPLFFDSIYQLKNGKLVAFEMES